MKNKGPREDLSWGEWKVHSQGNGKWLISRYAFKGEQKFRETYKKKKYSHLSYEEICAIAKRENHTFLQKKMLAEMRYDFDHTYLSPKLVEEFEQMLKDRSGNTEYNKTQLHYLKHYIFEYFVLKKKLPNPCDWHLYQYQFGEYILNEKKKSFSTITHITQTLNQYISFLNARFPDEVPNVKLVLVSSAKRKTIQAEKALEDDESPVRINIPMETYNLILKYSGDIKPHVKIARAFGLRRAEILGLTIRDIFVDHLAVKRQLEKYNEDDGPSYAPTKGRNMREVPYWKMQPDELYELVSRLKLMHPDTLSDKFARVIDLINEREKLSLDYTLHHFRHAFLTEQVRLRPIRDVQLAAGHADIRTTMAYLDDDREHSKQLFVPGKK